MLLLPSLAWARPRTLDLIIPTSEGKFPPAWTHSLRLSLLDANDESCFGDHRVWKIGQPVRFLVRANLRPQVYQVEVLCLSKGERKIAVYRQPLRWKLETKKAELNQLKWIETLEP